jgi:hypothetical protein
MAEFANTKDGMMEPWIETYTGDKFNFTHIQDISEINIEDIGHSLGNLCRYTGHCHYFYSVAQHSVLVSYLVPKEKAAWGLLHDAAEAYLGDMSSPLKLLNPSYKLLEQAVMNRIANRFNLPIFFWEDKDVKLADTSQLKIEAFYLLPNQGKDWHFPDNCVDGIKPKILTPEESIELFMKRAKELGVR